MSKLLTKLELNELSNEIDDITNCLEYCDDDTADRLEYRLDEIIFTLEKDEKLARINEIGLRVVK